ncbi:MAG: hypothetical protein K2Q27_12985 [Novosphingobium sp.]|nr:MULTISPECIES: hypothetical protein [unclassified Novosphingobium]KPF85931.1 hypothetical protein IP83_08085 [Novosphingobium sp. AAP93]MBY0394165.1 hypothetical protein [Novosphingobium sp.]
MLIRKIERFLSQHAMPRTKFGRLAAHDPRLVDDLRNGREPRPATQARVEHFMNTYRSASHVA